jgi:hypothetical protein
MQVKLKQESLNEARAAATRKRPASGGGTAGGTAGQGLSGEQWYSQNAMRAVNQVGRPAGTAGLECRIERGPAQALAL